MNYCSQCGHDITVSIPQGDNRERDVCTHCGMIFYQNPKIIAGCLPIWEDKVLLCKRAIEPRHGLWTLPAGFMENQESLAEAAQRETWEEALARVDKPRLYTVFSLPDINQVYMLFRAKLAAEEFAAGEESLEVALFTEETIPWDNLAFHTVRLTLQHYFTDRKTALFPLHVDTLYHQKIKE